MAAYSAVVSLLHSLDRRNPELFHGYTAEMLDSLRATAEYFQHVLEKISKSSRFDPEKIKSLEEKIRVAANEAEDVVDLKIHQIIEELSWTFGILQHQDLLPIVEKVDTTKKQVMNILSHHADQILELSADSLIDTSSTSYPMLSDKLEEDIVQGIDDDLEIIVKRLTGPPSDSLEIVAISGMGGIGKTTLARKAYDQLAIRYHHFDILAWVTVSQEFRFRNVLLEALRCISKKTDGFNAKEYDEMDENELADLVQKKLKGPRYLVVVDDIWNTDVWDSIRGIFPNYNNGSRVLLTTRETKVAMYANTSSPHEMSLLNLENGWKLLRDKVFGTRLDHPVELEEVGEEIVRKCQGLPLTISVIAGHLSKMPRTLGGWKDTAQTLSEIIASHQDKCLGVLGLSYHHLPNHLKPCFLSMSSFPEDFEVDARRLIRLWIAEGFIRTSGSRKSLEDVAMDYLEDLISRNLIQARKRRFNGEMKTCGVHDLLREFCLIEAEMTKHMRVERTYHTLPAQKHNARRFSFQALSCSVDDCCNLLPSIARSIYLFSHWDPLIHESFSRFNLLRVLAIFPIDIDPNVEFSSFPLVITKLFHLRYLQLPLHVAIPESISELQNLQTLIHSGFPSNITLPVKIWTMKNLTYIRLGVGGATYLPIPRGESLLNLEEFSGLSSISCTNEVFSCIPNLKRLLIEVPFLRNYSPNVLMDMSSLRKLQVFKCQGCPELPVCPINCYVIPTSVKDFVLPTSLKKLRLNSCRNFIWEDISSTVMMLPNLEELKLKFCRADDDEWILTDKDIFKSLKLLLLRSLNLEHWKASSDNFPILKRLVLKDFHNLQEIPTDFGEICTLESIELHDCCTTAEDSARNIEQEQEDMGNNFLKVYIHNNYWHWTLF